MLSFLGLLPHMCFVTLFVSSAKTFKKPLDPNEEKEYLLRYKNGDNEAKNILIERNLRLVAHIVKKYSEKDAETDDLISIGTIGLIKAITTFDMDKGARLATYAAKCIENEILMYFRSEKKRSGDVSLQDPIGKDKDGNEVSLIDKLYDEDENVFDKVDLKMQVKRLYECMKKRLLQRENTVLQLRYGLCGKSPLTQNEIAKKLNISRSYVSRIEKKAIEKIKDDFYN
ncbi:MAG: RNA polymerase sporulation sigma factor SigK [Clostridia bacterium]|nr:RNA polymerase sporulation sigma factor SigK [Oscillospiraceae bacterium]MDY5626582.1 RNA polymerase sporulation sigma factor SigK [Clostridia bacterium]